MERVERHRRSAPASDRVERASPLMLDRLAAMLTGCEPTQMLAVFTELGLPDLLAEGPRTVEQSAAEAGAHAPTLRRLLRALATYRVISQHADGLWTLTPTGNRLRQGVADSLQPVARAYAERWWWSAWGELLHSVRTGENAFQHVHGMGLYDYLARDPDAAGVYAESMGSRFAREAAAVLNAYDFSSVRSIVDVGGGHGAFAALIARAHPEVEVTVFDRPETVAGAPRLPAELADRIRFDAGDFFRSVPTGAEVYTLKNVLHDWDDENVVAILQSIGRAVPGDGKLLVIQSLIGVHDEPTSANLVDIALLVLTGGEERTESEYTELFREGGFALADVIPTESAATILVATPQRSHSEAA